MPIVVDTFSFLADFVRKETDSALLISGTFATVPETLDHGGAPLMVAIGAATVFAFGFVVMIVDHCRSFKVAKRVAQGEPVEQARTHVNGGHAEHEREQALADYQSDTAYM